MAKADAQHQGASNAKSPGRWYMASRGGFSRAGEESAGVVLRSFASKAIRYGELCKEHDCGSKM